jgi:hypothetical protein
MADIPKLIFALVVFCLLMAAPVAYFSHDPPTIMETRLMDCLLVIIGAAATALIALLKRPYDKLRR